MSGHPAPRRSASAIVRIGSDDPTLTGHAGLLLTGELVRRLEVVGTIEEAVNRVRPFEQRRRGLNAGELMVAWTSPQPSSSPRPRTTSPPQGRGGRPGAPSTCPPVRPKWARLRPEE